MFSTDVVILTFEIQEYPLVCVKYTIHLAVNIANLLSNDAHGKAVLVQKCLQNILLRSYTSWGL